MSGDLALGFPGQKAPLLSKAKSFWGLVSSVQVPRFGMFVISTNLLLLREQRQTHEVLPCCVSLLGVGFLERPPATLPLPIMMDPFYQERTVGGAALLLMVLFSSDMPEVDTGLVCLWDKVSSGSSYTLILDSLWSESIHKGQSRGRGLKKQYRFLVSCFSC